MAASTSRINIEFLSKGDSEVNKAFKRLGGETRRLNRDFQSLSKKSLVQVKNEFNKLGAGMRNSINGMQAQRNALNGLRNMADVTSKEFRQLTAEVKRLDTQLARSQSRGRGGRLGGIAKGVGAIAAGGIFGGPEGAVGAGVGLAMGGPTGGAVGAAIGAQVGMVRQQVGGIAEFSAALSLQRKALGLVIGDTEKFAKSQEFLLTTSRKLAIPQSVITRQFTALTASVVGAGQSVEDAEKVFKAIAAGIRGTGGNLEDMKAAMRATSQVFSKGKVSAEELRQQLGERLPGAFTLFADSMDKTPAELDKALEQGKVTLDDFMKFAQKLFATYGLNAEILASGPEAAGDRLRTALEELNDDLGALLRPIGAQFQKLSEDIVKDFASIVKAIRAMVDDVAIERKLIAQLALSKNERQKINVDAKNLAVQQIGGTVITKDFIDQVVEETLKNPLKTAFGGFGVKNLEKKLTRELGKTLEEVGKTSNFDVLKLFEQGTGNNLFDVTGQQRIKLLQNMLNFDTDNSFAAFRAGGGGSSIAGGEGGGTSSLNNIEKGAKAYFDTIGDFAKQTQDAVAGAFKGMEDALVTFVQTGKLNFSDLARSIMADLTRMLIRASLLNFLSPFPFFSKITGGKNAMGNAYDAGNKISKFAKGGIIKNPTMFAYGSGGSGNFGLMGEAGPEAIMPLKRGSNGKLGVQSSGGVGNIVVNVDASGSSIEGDSAQGEQFGRALAAAIQSELIQQKRPGGLLN